ncbi:MAG: 4'-phosphopantetheinyl transferase superfamily protein [Pseudomonadales bacterium]|nr:4'-phosphopantetheinyl transferase superfamily protein [Pseudomonadales bacterium]
MAAGTGAGTDVGRACDSGEARGDAQALAAALAALLPARFGVAVTAGAMADHRDTLRPEELPAIARAVDRRVHEFSTGRLLARQAMIRLGMPDAPIPRAADRSPVWPAACQGSITHAGGHVLAAVTRRESLCGLGVDLEEAHRVTAELHAKLFTPTERARLLDPAPGATATRRAALLFSAKEAVYKAVHPSVGVFIGFQEVEVAIAGDIDAPAGAFSMRYVGTHAPNRIMETGLGYFCSVDTRYVLTAFVIP